MKTRLFRKDLIIIFLVFVVSRLIIYWLGIRFSYVALFKYTQYLDVETLRHNLLKGVWFDHAQPPGFNLLLGLVLKIFGRFAPLAFNILFKIVTLFNAMLLLSILKKIVSHPYLPLIICLIYVLSPATMIFETELLYTLFVSLLLLLSIYFMIDFQKTRSWFSGFGIFVPLAVLCLTRSLYHITWLAVIALVAVLYWRNKQGARKILISALLCSFIVFSWYVKNYVTFGFFGTSSWIGMNFARVVFHDNESKDSSKIEAYPPLSEVGTYRKFISGDLEKKFAGVNDRDLLNERKNDSFVNQNHISVIEISKKYMKASKASIKAHPLPYVKNVLQSSIIFFTPATRYLFSEPKSAKIKIYDAVYSFNLSQFAEGKQQRRIALTLSSIPQMIIYFAVFFLLLRLAIKQKEISFVNLFIMLTILFVFAVSSLLEHYENMRFRYEVEPLYLILLAQAVVMLMPKKARTA